jgi:hypothetical protein
MALMYLPNKANLVNYILHAKHQKVETKIDRLENLIGKSIDSTDDYPQSSMTNRAGLMEFPDIVRTV